MRGFDEIERSLSANYESSNSAGLDVLLVLPHQNGTTATAENNAQS